MGENMLHELIPKGTMILDESNLAKSPDSKSMESIVQNILPNHYFNPILTFIHNTQKKRMFSDLIYFQMFFRKTCHTLNSESTRWGMLVTSWNSKATPDVPHPMSGHDFYSKLSTGLGWISPLKRWVFLWKNHGGSFLCWVDVLKNDAEVAVVGFCWEDVILMKLQFSRPGGRTLKSDVISGSLGASMNWYVQVLHFFRSKNQSLSFSVWTKWPRWLFWLLQSTEPTKAPVWKMILPWDISWYVSRTCFGVLDVRHVPIPDPNSDCPWLGRIVRSLSAIQPKNRPNQTMKRIE